MKLSEMSKSGNANMKNDFSKISGRQKNITQAYEELKGCSNEELMKRLSHEIQLQKQNGTFDFEGLCNTIERMKIYLPNATYQNMMNIIENLR